MILTEDEIHKQELSKELLREKVKMDVHSLIAEANRKMAVFHMNEERKGKRKYSRFEVYDTQTGETMHFNNKTECLQFLKCDISTLYKRTKDNYLHKNRYAISAK